MSASGGEEVFRCDVRRADGRTLVAAVGELDLSGVDRFDAIMREQLAAGPVLLDLRQLTFMDSTGVRVLDGLLRDGEREGWDLAVRAEMHRAVRQLLDLTGMSDVLPTESPTASEEPR